MHTLLKRQLKRTGLADDTTPPDASAWQDFMGRVDHAYTQMEQDRYLLERSLTISSREMQELYEEARQRASQLEALHQVTLGISSEHEVDTLLSTLTERVLALLDADDAGIFIYQPERDVLSRTVSIGESPVALGAELRRGESLSGRVWQSGKPLVVDDYYRWEGRIRDDRNDAGRTIVGVPIQFGDSFLGVFTVAANSEQRTFTDSDVSLLARFADQAAVAIQNAQLYTEVKQQAVELSTLVETATAVSATLDLEERLELIAEHLLKASGADGCTISRWDREADTVATWIDVQLKPRMADEPGTAYALEDFPATRAVLEERRTISVFASDPEADAAETALLREYGIKSLLMLPLATSEGVIGLVELGVREREQAFGADEIRLFQGLANQAAIAIEHARLFEEARLLAAERERDAESLARERDMLRALSQSAENVLRADTPDDVFRAIGDEVSKLDYHMVVFDLNADGTQLTLSFHTFKPGVLRAAEKLTGILAHNYAFPVKPGSLLHQAIVEKRLVSSADMIEGTVAALPPAMRPLAGKLLATLGLEQAIYAPLIVGGDIRGLLVVTGAGMSEASAPIVGAFANQASLAIEKANLYDSTRERATRLELMGQVGRDTTSILVLEDLLHQTVRLITDTFQYHNTGIMLIDGDDLVLAATALESEKPLEGQFQLRVGKEGIAGWVAEHGEPLLVPDVSRDFRYRPAHKGTLTKSELAVPIKSNEKIIGVMGVQSSRLNAFSQDDTFTLQTIADQLAVAIQNARLYQELGAYSDFLEEAVEQRTAELQQEKERVEAIFSSTADAVFISDPEGKILDTNPAFEAQTGYRTADIVGQPMRLLIAEATPQQSIQEAIEARRMGRAWRGNVIIRHEDGTEYDADINMAPLHQSERATGGYVAVIRDISAQKELQRMKDAFVANVSHELRTPITSLKLFHDLLETVSLDKRDEILGILRRETERLARIVEDVLRLARLDQGTTALDLVPTDLNTLVGQYVSDRAPLAAERELHLTLDEAASLPEITVDQGLVVQVLGVLLSNAFNYTPPGGEVVVRTQVQQLRGRAWAGFKVNDSGPGITRVEQSHLFRRFFRGDAGRVSGAPGTGLGLAIAKEIVEHHGGLIEVESEGVAGKGTTFSVWFPEEQEEPTPMLAEVS